MNKVIELLIDFENTTFEDLGVNIMSLVDMPAIGINWMAFSKHQFVSPSAGETQDEFISRCIPVLIGEGKDQDQAAAICYSYWEGRFDLDPSGLTPYVDQIEDPRQREVYKAACRLGEEIDPDNTLVIDLSRDRFTTIGEVIEGIVSLDILGKGGVKEDEPAETRYRYTGPTAQRPFCKAMMRLNKIYTRDEIEEMEGINSGFGPGPGGSPYSIWDFKGGVNCQHYWEELQVFRNNSGQLVMVSNGPARGEAGKSCNGDSPSPTGAVRNNASLKFNQWTFSADDKMIVTGPAMVPNQLIPRRDPNGNQFFVYFSEETIAKIAKEFIARHQHNNTDINHSEKITEENTMLESWIVEDPQLDKSKALGYEGLPQGTWMVSYKINNPETWAKIKSGELNGFSVAGDFIQKLVA